MVEIKTEYLSSTIENVYENVIEKQKAEVIQKMIGILGEKDKTLFDINNDLNDMPKPSRAVIDQDSISKWIDAEADNDFKNIKKKLIENIKHIDFSAFQENLGVCIEKFNKEISGDYAVMWDYKPHSSKRWTYKLIENSLSRKPIYSNFFNPSAEKVAIKTVEKLHDQKVSKFVTVDDSAYSGEQVFNRFLKPILENFKLNYPSEKPEFYVIIPFITNSFKEKVDNFMKENDCKVNLIYSQVMPQVKDVLTKEELSLMDEKRNGSIEVDSDEPLYRGLTLTFFDHRVADDHSFSPEVAKVIKVKYEKPYKESETKYSKIEKNEFKEYWKPYQEKINKEG